MMDIITLARELGKAIQQDEMYIQLQAAGPTTTKTSPFRR